VIALLNGNLVSSSKSNCKGLRRIAEKIRHQGSRACDNFYGSNTTQAQIDEVTGFIAKTYPDHEVEVHEGGQPHYQFILSIE
jgi:Predicted kinase related to dihydroxyacetone kinase